MYTTENLITTNKNNPSKSLNITPNIQFIFKLPYLLIIKMPFILG